MIIKVYNGLAQKVVKGQGIFVLVFVLFYAISFACWAQPDKVSQDELQQYYPKKLITRVELVAGPSFVYGRSDDYVQDGKLGFSTGIGLEHDFNSKFSIKVNFLYEIKGFRQALSGVNMDSGYARPSNSIFDLTLNYVSVSPLAIYHVPVTRISLGCGPYFAYLINSKIHQETYINGSLASIYRRRLLTNELYKSYDMGLTSTVAYSIAFKKRLVTVNLSYNLGLLDINQPHVSSLRNNSIVLVFAYQVSGYSNHQ